MKAGSLISGIDFELNPVRPATVRGTLRSNTGAVDRAILWVIGKAGEGGGSNQAQKGEFVINDLAPGTYTISAHTTGEPPLFGATTVQLRGEDVGEVELVMQPVPKIEAHVEVQGGDLSDIKLDSVFFMRSDRLEAVPFKIARPQKDGNFEIFLIPGEYTLTFGPSTDGFNVQKIVFGDQVISNWKLSIDSSSAGRKLLIELAPRSRR